MNLNKLHKLYCPLHLMLKLRVMHLGDELYIGTDSNIIVESGALDHLINREDLENDFSELKTRINISVAKSGIFITAKKRDQIVIITPKVVARILEDVRCCPEVQYKVLENVKGR